MTVALATVAHDPRNELVPKLAEHLPRLREIYDGIGVMASRSATSTTIDLLREHGVLVEQETAPDGTDTIGRRRRGCLAVALRTGADHVIYADMDRVICRSARATPASRPTMTDDGFIGRSCDAARCGEPRRGCMCRTRRQPLRADGGEASPSADDDTIATDVAWPLFVESRGLTLAYRESRLHYENHTWFASGVSEKERIERDPRSWSLRFHLAKQMMDAFARWGPYEASR